MAITYKEDFDLNALSFEDVIDGLNKYFAEDDTSVRVPRSLVEIKGYNNIIFYRFDAEKYLDKLIAWLRTEHGIFYYPGMEAKYAKTERIPPLTERSMDEGALNSLKKLYKRVTGEEPEVDSHTIIADGIWNAVSVKDSQIVKLQTQMKKQGEELRILKSKCSSLNEKDIMDYIRQEASKNGYNLPEKVDGEPLTIERVFHDLFDLMRRRGEELRILGLKCRRMNEIVEELNTLNDEIKKENPYE